MIAIEPVAENIKVLHKTFDSEDYPQVTIIPKGAWKEPGKMRFLVGSGKEGRLADIPAGDLTYEWWGVEDHLNPERYKDETIVQVDRVDNMIKPFKLDQIDFILVETNGTEFEVVQGLKEALPFTRHIGARGHVKRDGHPIYKDIDAFLTRQGFDTLVTDEGMVLARKKT